MTGDYPGLRMKLTWRLILPLSALSFLNSIDRVNVSYAAVRMNPDIGLTAETYGFGITCFFLAYLIFQYPHAALLGRIGARRWLFGSVLAWGVIGTAMAFVTNVYMFYALRFLLGVAESGLAPGMTFFISQWMPRRFRALAVAVALASVPFSMVVGGPLSGWMMDQDNPVGMAGWRWMFLLQGIPILLAAFVAHAYFVDRMEQTKWLSPAEKEWLAAELEKDRGASEAVGVSRFSDVANSPAVWACAFAWLCIMTGAYGMVFWLPQVINQIAPGYTNLQIGLISALPQVGVMAGMLVNAWHSDKSQERMWHVGLGALLAGACLSLAAYAGGGSTALILLIAMGVGLGAAQGAFWAIPTTLLQGRAALAGIALINMFGTMGGVVGPALIGMVRERTGSFAASIVALGVLLIAAFVLVMMLRAYQTRGVRMERPA
jgi:ACS family tartrate transporter-like MFS transporter